MVSETAFFDLRVLDLSMMSGAYTAKLFADLGADVIKVEPPAGCEHRWRGASLNETVGQRESWSFQYHNTNKRGITLDLDDATGQQSLLDLARDADLLIEGYRPRYLDDRGLGYEHLSALNPRLVMTSISPFGQSGPYRDYRGDDIVAAAMGGLMFLCGMPGRPPSQPGGAIGAVSTMQADVVAAVGSLIALLARDRSGLGQHVDVSMQEAVAVANENALGYYAVMHSIRRRCGLNTWGPSGPTPSPALRPCKDGWVAGGGGGLNAELLSGWLEEARRTVPAWLNDDWWRTTSFLERATAVAELLEPIFRCSTREQLTDAAQSRRMGLAPVRTPKEVFDDPELQARGFWATLPGEESGPNQPGAPYRFSATPWRLRQAAPGLGEHNRDLRAASGAWISARQTSVVAGTTSQSDKPLPLQGLVVLDFSWQAAAPLATKYLAAFGAKVIRVESERRLDVFRTVYPRPPGTTSVNASHIFANFNTDKLGVTIDLSTRRGQELIHRLLPKVDVVVDNFGVDPFPRWGLTYEEMRRMNPSLIVLRSSVYGRTGARQNYTGFGSTINAAMGLNTMMGFPEDPPVGTCIAFPDYSSNPHHAAVAILAALYYRNRTGLGQFIDLSQMESSAAFWGHALLAYGDASPGDEQRSGNLSPWAAPHGAYRCAPRGDDHDRWIAIACNTEQEWKTLAGVLHAASLEDRRFDSLTSRLRNVAVLDAAVDEACRRWDAYTLMDELQRGGVPAGVVQNQQDLLEHDPHMRERGFYVWLEHGELGRIPHDGIPFRLSNTVSAPSAPAPLLGEHTHQVLQEFLELSWDEIAELDAGGVLR